MPPLGGGVAQWLVAAPSRPRYGPFGPHLGMGGPGLGVTVTPPAVGGVARAGGGLDSGVPTAAWRRELHEPAGLLGHGALVCSCCCLRSVAAIGGGGRALPRIRYLAVPHSRLPFFCSHRYRYFGHGEMAVVIARSWWREQVGDEFGGARWSVGVVVFLGVGRNPCWKDGTDAVTPTGAAIPS
jgi:hypothetical protein